MVVDNGQVMANVHITPMRASRALALRYLATKFGIDMENVAVGPPEIIVMYQIIGVRMSSYLDGQNHLG